MSNKFFVSLALLLSSGFLITESVTIEKSTKPAKKAEFKYKLKAGDMSREFMADLVGNTKSYFYDLAKNFKKHPEVIVATLAGIVPYMLYQNEIHKKLTDFVYGVANKDGKLVGDHKKEIAAVWVVLLALLYANKDKINQTFFSDDEEACEFAATSGKDAE